MVEIAFLETGDFGHPVLILALQVVLSLLFNDVLVSLSTKAFVLEESVIQTSTTRRELVIPCLLHVLLIAKLVTGHYGQIVV